MANGSTTANDNSATVQRMEREPLVLNKRSYHWITERICGIIEGPQPLLWWLLFLPSLALMSWVGFGLVYLISTGVGVWVIITLLVGAGLSLILCFGLVLVMPEH